jgi:molybdate transport system substrate-binding protein
MKPLTFLAALALGLAVLANPAAAGRVTVAVAANFLLTAQNIAAGFEAETGHEVALVHGSTGKLYAQIVAGAPFDVFLSADAARPAELVANGLAAGVRTYSFGRLALVLRDRAETSLDATLARTDRRLAIADPAVAPYGVAAREVLQGIRGTDWAENLVYGESVGQAFAFVATGNAPLGLVALSQTRQGALDLKVIEVPEDRHAPLRQDAVLLMRARDNAVARAFFDYLDGALARAMIVEAGYGVTE